MHQNNTIHREERYYRQIVDLANVAIVKFDTKFILNDFTGNAEKVFGYKKEEVLGRSLYETIVPHYESTGRDLVRLIDQLIANIHSYEYNVNENIRKDGKVIWMQWYNSELRDEKNVLTGILSIGVEITDRVMMERALKESEERFKTLSNLTFEGIIIHENGLILDCNLSFERQIGYSRKELIGMQLLEQLIPPGYHVSITNMMKNDSAQYEAEAIHKDGTIIPISIESGKAKIGDREVRVAAIRNISELKKTINELDKYKNHLEEIVVQRTEELKEKSRELKKQNELLQLERNQLRTIIDHIPDIIYIKDTQSRFLNVNQKQVQHFKKKALSEVIGKNDFDFYSKEFAEKYLSNEQEILRKGIPMINMEELSIDENGNQIYLSTTKVPLKDHLGKITGIVGIGRDMTEKIRADNELKIQKMYLEESNHLLGERSEKIEKLNAQLFESNDKLEAANHILQERKEELEATLEQLKMAQTQLIQSEKMASLGILLAGIAHEINNPVNFIYAGVNSMIKDYQDVNAVIREFLKLKKGAQDTDEILDQIAQLTKQLDFNTAHQAIFETMEDIKLGATRIKEIVNGLSRFSRMENEDWKRSDIHDELNSVLVLLKNKYKHHIKIERNYDEDLPEVDCHAGKLNQVFMNIINNAIDAIGENEGTIILQTTYRKGWVYISIRDTGRGIETRDLSRIFDPFFSTKEVGHGLGLGLAISYSIIQEHQGELTVKSSPGKGSEFAVKIPVKH
ncbi:MAG: PAS domain S-box protein [Bacteroidales bacterium]|nr:PAS domain S-box protein [Bacteroidales bacterium]